MFKTVSAKIIHQADLQMVLRADHAAEYCLEAETGEALFSFVSEGLLNSSNRQLHNATRDLAWFLSAYHRSKNHPDLTKMEFIAGLPPRHQGWNECAELIWDIACRGWLNIELTKIGIPEGNLEGSEEPAHLEEQTGLEDTTKLE